jgi:hypothetical protein
VDPRLDSSTLESPTTIIQGENSPGIWLQSINACQTQVTILYMIFLSSCSLSIWILESRKEFGIQLNSQAIGRVRKLRSQNTPDQSKSRGANFEAQNLNSKAVLTSVRNFIPKSFKPNIIKNIPRKHWLIYFQISLSMLLLTLIHHTGMRRCHQIDLSVSLPFPELTMKKFISYRLRQSFYTYCFFQAIWREWCSDFFQSASLLIHSIL